MPKNIERLEKLCQFLDNLPDNEFNFETFVTSHSTHDGCGTVCCAIGWCPAIFPAEWKWDTGASAGVTLRSARGLELHKPFTQAVEFFGLSKHATRQAFLPWEATTGYEKWEADLTPEEDENDDACAAAKAGGAAKQGFCLETAGPKTVAANIRRIMNTPE